MRGPERRRLARVVAAGHDGVASRRLLRRAGIGSADVAAEVRAERWAVHGRQTVAVHTAPLPTGAQWWRAVWEVGHGIAALDGVSALLAGGLTGYEERLVHVSIVHNHRVAAVVGVRQHQITRRRPDEVIRAGVPRVRPAIAAIRAAHWAASDRQAALILVMTVQQRLATADALGEAARFVRGRRRRAFVQMVVRHICHGVQTLGELDFARLCRQRGLPEPDRQALRQTPQGRIYLDVRWRCGVVVEIDGQQHRRGLAVTRDHLRDNELALGREIVLRIDNLGLLLAPEAFMDQVEAALRSRASGLM